MEGEDRVIELEEIGSRQPATGPVARSFIAELAGETFELIATLDADHLRVAVNGHQRSITVYDNGIQVSLFTEEGAFDFEVHPVFSPENIEQGAGNGFVAPMNGTITEILAVQGQTVTAGKTLLIMEAMKMEHAMHAPSDGVVGEVFFAVGDLVNGGATLLEFEPAEPIS